MEGSIRKARGMTEFVRCVLDGPAHRLRARASGSQSSGVLSSMCVGNGLLVGPPESEVLEDGSRHPVLRFVLDRGSAEPGF